MFKKILNFWAKNSAYVALVVLIAFLVFRQFFTQIIYAPFFAALLLVVLTFIVTWFYGQENKTNSLWFCALSLLFLLSYLLQNEEILIKERPLQENSLESNIVSFFRTILFISGLALILFALVLLVPTLKEQTSYKKLIPNRVFSVFILLSFLVTLNFAAKHRPILWDLTLINKYSLSKEGKEIIREIKDPVVITAFYPFFHDLQREVSIFLQDIASANSFIKVSIHDALREREIAAEKKVDRNGWIVIEKLNPKAVDVDNLSQVRKISVTSEDDFRHLERDLLSALVSITTPRRNVYFTTNHGERLPEGFIREESLSIFKDYLMKNNYEIKYLTAKNNFPEKVNEDAHVVVIAGARQNFTPKEKKALQEYLERGGKFLILLRRNGADLSFLLEPFGIKFENSPARSEVALKPKSNNLVSERYADSYFTRRLLQLPEAEKFSFFPDSGSFSIEAKADVFANSLVYSDSRSFIDKNNNSRYDPGLETFQVLNLAVVAGYQKEGKEKRALVAFASSDFLLDRYISYGQNLYLGLNSIHWLLEEERISSLIPAKFEEKPISLSPAQDDFLFYGFVVFWPLSLLLGGFFITRLLRK